MCSVKYITVMGMLFLIPNIIFAQSGIAGDLKGLQSELDNIYNQMLPLCSSLIGVGRGLAGFAATWYIAYRVWRHIANAEPIDFYPLFRPFVIGFCVLIFPSVIALMNGVLQPTVTATNAMVTDSDAAIAQLLLRILISIKCMSVPTETEIAKNGMSTHTQMTLPALMKECLKASATTSNLRWLK
jgi:hypothetical protein